MVETLKGRVCVVTGSAKSIGFGIASMYAGLDASVAMIDIDPEVIPQAEKLAASGKKVKGYIVDITDQKAVLDCFREIESGLGPVFSLVNNAGIVDTRPVEEVTPEIMDKVMRVNVHGTLYCCQGAIASMKSLKDGRIINFSSKSGKTGSALMSAYSAAKGAIIALTHSLAFELAPHNIKVNCLCPGITDATGVWNSVSAGYVETMKMSRDEIIKKFTSKIPLGRLTDIQDLVDYVQFLTVSGDYCTGQALNVTGGREVH